MVPDYAGTVSHLVQRSAVSGLPEPAMPTHLRTREFTSSPSNLGTAGSQLISAGDGALERGDGVVTVTAGPAARLRRRRTSGHDRGRGAAVLGHGHRRLRQRGTDYSGTARVKSTDPKLAAPGLRDRWLTATGSPSRPPSRPPESQRLGLSAVTGAVGEICRPGRPGSGGPVRAISGAPRRSPAGEPVTVTVTAVDRYRQRRHRVHRHGALHQQGLDGGPSRQLHLHGPGRGRPLLRCHARTRPDRNGSR